MHYFIIFFLIFSTACHQLEIDKQLEDVGLNVAKTGAEDFQETIKEREAQNPKKP